MFFSHTKSMALAMLLFIDQISGRRSDMYYILEIEMSFEFKELLDAAAERENLTLEEFIVHSLTVFLKDAENVRKLKAEYDDRAETNNKERISAADENVSVVIILNESLFRMALVLNGKKVPK